MDLTSCFVEILGLTKRNPSYESKVTEDSSNNKKFLFNTKLSELVSSITYMKDYLISNKKDYINIYNSILSISSSMTDEERDQIDKDVQDFVKLCNDVIKILRVEIKSRTSKQQYEHENNAINLVESYVKEIHEFHNKQKALRLRRNLDCQNFFRLSKSISKTDDLKLAKSAGTVQNKNVTHKNEQLKSNAQSNAANRQSERKYLSHLDDENESHPEDYGLSSEELKLFKDEGNRIYDEMNSMNSEVKNIGKKLVEIAKLQEVFSENVLKQDTDLNQLNSTTIISTEHIREGNEQLREAMRKNAGFRVWILFFITTLAFVVLFLDWYND